MYNVVLEFINSRNDIRREYYYNVHSFMLSENDEWAVINDTNGRIMFKKIVTTSEELRAVYQQEIKDSGKLIELIKKEDKK